MSTFYDFDFNVDDYIQKIETHYFNDGWDVEGLEENGQTSVYEAPRGFKSEDVENVIDVFVGDVFVHAVCEVGNDLLVFTFAKGYFMRNWSEKIWAKFRRDSYTAVCPECGEKMALSVAGRTLSDIGRIEQFHCENCHHTWVGYPSGKFIREGVL